tara:strand:- start:586 stop:711 length:126 start_codon:yes stop_codon:yes gene_type:complete
MTRDTKECTGAISVTILGASASADEVAKNVIVETVVSNLDI